MFSEPGLRFTTHDMGVACYGVSDVSIAYGGTERLLCSGQLAPAKTAADETRYPNVKFGSYPAFADPLQVRWRARDGSDHACVLALADLFPDRQVLHTEAPARIYQAAPLTGGEPTIIVELVERTLNIYMFASLQLAPGSAGGAREERDHRTLAFSRTF